MMGQWRWCLTVVLPAVGGIPPIMTGGDKWVATSGSSDHSKSPGMSESLSEPDEVISDHSP